MTKDEFLKDPSALALQMDKPAPADWIAAAWGDPQFRANVEHALVRSVSKNGDFFVAAYWLEVLPTFLEAEQVVSLYERIRDESGRPEHEWRRQFECAFAAHAGMLPAARKWRGVNP